MVEGEAGAEGIERVCGAAGMSGYVLGFAAALAVGWGIEVLAKRAICRRLRREDHDA